MSTSILARHVIHATAYASFVLLVALVTRSVDCGRGKCPSGKFGRQCRLTCHCKDDVDCNDTSGTCPGPCAEGWSGPSCQRQNVVLGMSTDMKTSDWSKGARAVDGDVRTCVTSTSNRTGWWRVDLLVQKTLFFMEILFANQTARPGRIRVHVSDYIDTFLGKPCALIPASHKATQFTCDLPSTGRYLGVMNTQGQITLCEVYVYVCEHFTFGANCSQECSCSDPREICNGITGSCNTGCRDGYTGITCTQACPRHYGKECRYKCGRCYNNQSCDHETGRCPSGCAPGWTGPLCQQACHPGTYGIDCIHGCHRCLDNASCDPQTGNCPWRCEPGWKGVRCDAECEPGQHGQNCEFQCGHCYGAFPCDRYTGMCPFGCDSGFEGLFCTKECMPGAWGPNCQFTCGHCLNHTCDRTTGHCGISGCQKGWSASKCNIECRPGSFGDNCARKCGKCLTACDVKDGTCPTQCMPGWQGRLCTDCM
ncbi:hypothetical protein BsWGS_02790 [Bradybaena similaris]